MKKNILYILVLSVVALLLTGCLRPNLPEKHNTKEWSNISIDQFVQEIINSKGLSKFEKVNENVFYYQYGMSGYYAKVLCESKGGNYKEIRNFKYQNGMICIRQNDEPMFFRFYSDYKGERGYFDYSKETISEYINYKRKQEINKQKFFTEYEKRKKLEREQEALKEKQKIARVKQLRSQTGQKTMTFFDNWRFNGDELLCRTKCQEKNLMNNGYLSLQYALNDGWQFVTKINEISFNPNPDCQCIGAQVLLKK